ncbi:molybdopterin adenylyltransferase [Burkholderiales bacterium]|nr:molybdopterin adenylyltransferase [Burkholderiales bacterium]
MGGGPSLTPAETPHGSAAPGLEAHRREATSQVATAVLTVSDTRTLETDRGGALAAELLSGAGHPIAWRRIVRDEPGEIGAAVEAALLDPAVRAVVVTGGTGVAPRDVTPESVEPLLERIVPGFGELFRALSYEEIGSAAILSRALAGLSRGKVVFVVPGSTGAVRLALERLVLPELGHLAAEAVKTR